MAYKGWNMAAMEEYGYATTSDGLVNKVAYYLVDIPNDMIDMAEFRNACIACDVDPDSFTKTDLQKLQRKLNKIT